MSKWLWIVFVLLSGIYLVFAWKNPFSGQNSISNMSPFLDTFHYSNPAWNWVNGRGFRMIAFDREQPKIVPPLYGMTLIPFFAIFKDVRSYFYTNIILNLFSIGLFVSLVAKIFKESRIKILLASILGLILVSNYYFYYLPSLLMTENLTILLILLAANILVKEYSLLNTIMTLLVVVALTLTKISNFPVIVWMMFWTFIKFIRNLQVKKIRLSERLLLAVSVAIILVFITIKLVIPNWNFVFKGDNWFNTGFLKPNLIAFLPQFLGFNGSYLWFKNPQVETVVGMFSLIGLVVGVVYKKFRKTSFIILSLMVLVTSFHAMSFYPEGRYISVVIPLYIIASGFTLEMIARKNKILSIVICMVFVLLYLGIKVNINNYYERKYTSLKREILNKKFNVKENNNNFKMVMDMNEYFKNSDGNDYLGTYMTSFMFYYFGNQKYKMLAISENQLLGDGIDYKWKSETESLVDYYQKLLNEGKRIYVNDYFIDWAKDGNDTWNNLTKKFNLKLINRFESGYNFYKVENKQ